MPEKLNLSTMRMPMPLCLLLCAIGGALNVLAFAPFGLWPLQIVLLALLFHAAWSAPSTKQVFLRGWLYHGGFLTCGVYWLYVSMHDYGGMPAWMAALAVVLLGFGLSTYYGLLLAAGRWLEQRRGIGSGSALLLVFPAMWALADWLRGWLFTGFPWIATGYAHGASPLAGFAPLLGVYGLGWLAALAAGALALLPQRRLPVAAMLLVFGAGWLLQPVRWTAPHGRPVSVRLLQGSVPQEVKFDSGHVTDSLALYYRMIEARPADLIVTPETALPVFVQQLPPDYLPSLAQYARQSGSTIALGISTTSGPPQYANSVIALPPAPSGRLYQYDKHHLVPFGEFIPFGFRWFVNMMNIPLGDFSTSPVLQPPLRVKDQWVQPNICYEDLFGEEIAAQIAAGSAPGHAQPTLLLNMSNIAWFGDTIALPQHLQISQMRALETGRPMLRSTNTGMTAVIDPKGHVLAKLQPFERAALSAKVQGYRGTTPYIVLGNRLIVVLLLASLALAWLMGRKKRAAP